MNNVESLFKNKGILLNNTYVYNKGVAIQFIMECQKENVNILGIDAFIIKPNFHQPSQDNSIDFTTKAEINNKKPVWQKAIDFLTERDEIFYFEIVTS